MLEAGRVVLATAGRDKGSVFLVLGSEENGRILIADGHRRTLQRPKAKNKNHLSETAHTISLAAATGNQTLRRLLRAVHQGEAANTNVNG